MVFVLPRQTKCEHVILLLVPFARLTFIRAKPLSKYRLACHQINMTVNHVSNLKVGIYAVPVVDKML